MINLIIKVVIMLNCFEVYNDHVICGKIKVRYSKIYLTFFLKGNFIFERWSV